MIILAILKLRTVHQGEQNGNTQDDIKYWIYIFMYTYPIHMIKDPTNPEYIKNQ